MKQNPTTSLSQIKSEMRAKIENASVKHGGYQALSQKLGKSNAYVSIILRRNNLSGLQKLCDMIEEIK